MTAPVPVITAWWDLSGGDSEFFTWDDVVRGAWDNGTYLWAGDIATDITGYATSVSITRGRSSPLDEVQTGTCTITANNHTRNLDPFYTSSPFYGNIKPGKRISVAWDGVTVFDGDVGDFNYSYAPGQLSTASISAVDRLAAVAATSLEEHIGSVGQLEGVRMAGVLERSEVNLRVGADIDFGQSTLQADLVAAGTNTLAYCHLLARSGLGRFFAARDRPLTYRDRHSVINVGAVAVTFADDSVGSYGTTTPFHGVDVQYGREMLFNQSIVSRVGGSTEIFTDTDSVNEFGIVSTQDTFTELLLEDDAQSYDMGLYLVGIYAEPRQQFAQFAVELAGLTTLQRVAVLQLDIGSLVRGVFTPNRLGTAIDRRCVVEGIQIDASADGSLVMTLSVSDADQVATWIWDDTSFGLWDGTTVFTF